MRPGGELPPIGENRSVDRAAAIEGLPYVTVRINVSPPSPQV